MESLLGEARRLRLQQCEDILNRPENREGAAGNKRTTRGVIVADSLTIKELLRLDHDLIAEYESLLAEDLDSIQKKEGLLHELAVSLDSVSKEREQQEKRLQYCMNRVWVLLHGYSQIHEYEGKLGEDYVMKGDSVEYEELKKEVDKLKNELSVVTLAVRSLRTCDH